MKTRFYFLLVLVTLTGCASTSVAPDVAESIRSNKIAVVAYVTEKKINYDEMVYKVLWNETRSQEAAFGTFWDIDSDLSNQFAGELQELGLDAHSAVSALPVESYKQLQSAIASSIGDDGMLVPLVLDEEPLGALRDAGFKHLMVLRSGGFLVQTTSMIDVATVTLPTVLIVSDLDTNTEQYSEMFWMQGNMNYEESVREIEENGLVKLKGKTTEWLEAATKRDIPTLLHMAKST